jgi:histidinol-phosphate aminotransferase
MHNELLALARAEILTMAAYRSARNEAHTGTIWLDANENPWQNTPYHRYPEAQPTALIHQLASIYAIAPTQLLVTRGSNEGIDLLIRLFCRAYQDQILICPPTYGMYSVTAAIQGATIKTVPLIKERNFALDVTRILQDWQPQTKLIFLCSPNNPTGNLLTTADILTLASAQYGKAIVIVDEAYIEFATEPSLLSHLARHPNLVILRTLSKAYGLAGIRCGVVLAHREIVALLKKIIPPYPIPTPVIEIACQQLTLKNLQREVAIIHAEREKLTAYLQQLPYIKKIWPSQANFLLAEVVDIQKILALCLKRGIVLRDRSHDYNLSNCLRLTIGTPQENLALMEALQHA